MKDERKTKDQLIRELAEMRQRIAELEASETERKRAEEAQQRLERELALRNKIVNIFLTVPDEEMYGEVLQVILEAMESKYGVFGYIDEKGTLVVPSMPRHIWDQCQVPDKTIVFPRETWGNSIWPRAIREKKALYSNDRSTLTPEGHVPILRNISVPILHQGEAIGLLQVANKETDYEEKDVQLLETVSSAIAPVLNARLQRDREERERKRAEEALQEYSKRREEMVEERTRELRDAQEQLVRQEKLAVLGQLAGGVGHELRNPLGAIKNAAYFLNMALEEPDPEVKETLEILEKEVATSERIISSLLDFARAKPPTRRKVDINDVVQVALSRTTVPENVEVVRQLDQALPTILADPDQLAQVFGNIILNGIQAMPEGGQLVIKSEVESPGWMTVSFTDTGVGISEENLGKVFEPLFTTKAKGIGLGLAIVKTLVEGHGGTIEVASEVGKGSTFTVRLPTGVAAWEPPPLGFRIDT